MKYEYPVMQYFIKTRPTVCRYIRLIYNYRNIRNLYYQYAVVWLKFNWRSLVHPRMVSYLHSTCITLSSPVCRITIPFWFLLVHCTFDLTYSITRMLCPHPSLLMLFAYDITDEEIVHGLEPWFDLRNDVVGELSVLNFVYTSCCVAREDGRGYY